MCPFVRHALYTALYSSSESTDDIYYVYGMFAMLLACISALFEAWAVKDRVYSSSPTIYPPSVRRALYTVLYNSSESTDDVCYVNGIIGKLLACIFALVGTWAVRNRLLAQCSDGCVRPCVRLSVMHSIRPCTIAASLQMMPVMYMRCLRCFLRVSLFWLGRGQFRIGYYYSCSMYVRIIHSSPSIY